MHHGMVCFLEVDEEPRHKDCCQAINDIERGVRPSLSGLGEGLTALRDELEYWLMQSQNCDFQTVLSLNRSFIIRLGQRCIH